MKVGPQYRHLFHNVPAHARDLGSEEDCDGAEDSGEAGGSRAEPARSKGGDAVKVRRNVVPIR